MDETLLGRDREAAASFLRLKVQRSPIDHRPGQDLLGRFSARRWRGFLGAGDALEGDFAGLGDGPVAVRGVLGADRGFAGAGEGSPGHSWPTSGSMRLGDITLACQYSETGSVGVVAVLVQNLVLHQTDMYQTSHDVFPRHPVWAFNPSSTEPFPLHCLQVVAGIVMHRHTIDGSRFRIGGEMRSDFWNSQDHIRVVVMSPKEDCVCHPGDQTQSVKPVSNDREPPKQRISRSARWFPPYTR